MTNLIKKSLKSKKLANPHKIKQNSKWTIITQYTQKLFKIAKNIVTFIN